jgi:hypothetical protein
VVLFQNLQKVLNEYLVRERGESPDLMILEIKSGMPVGTDTSPCGGTPNMISKRIAANA